MQKIASPTELQSELRRLLAYCGGPEKPSREKLASELRDLADRVAMEFDTPEALKKYLQDHPDADKSKHTVKKPEKDEGGGDAKDKGELKPHQDALHKKLDALAEKYPHADKGDLKQFRKEIESPPGYGYPKDRLKRVEKELGEFEDWLKKK